MCKMQYVQMYGMCVLYHHCGYIKSGRVFFLLKGHPHRRQPYEHWVRNIFLLLNRTEYAKYLSVSINCINRWRLVVQCTEKMWDDYIKTRIYIYILLYTERNPYDFRFSLHAYTPACMAPMQSQACADTSHTSDSSPRVVSANTCEWICVCQCGKG